MNRDIIAIGASAGGIEVLLDMVGGLPRELPASLFIVLHMAPHHESLLPELLAGRGPLPVRQPLHDESIARGTIYVAPPDNHLLLRPGTMAVVRGPRENGHRPAADALFRSAASAYGSRVIGVVLSGYQDCGTAGMMSIKARGGLAVVQAPETATVPDMPRSVLEHVAVDHVATPRELSNLLAQLARGEAGATSQPDLEIAKLEGDVAGTPVDVVCPLCNGVLTEAEIGSYEHFRCHVGHTFSLATLVRDQGEQMERALWAAVRALEESAALSQRLAERERGDLAARFREKAAAQAAEADLIRRMLLRGPKLSDDDAKRLA